ncbi:MULTISPECIES: hypothetical protein [unclassified Beijerinckia]|uniref:hypothetical protein n=1 Tax=unclassified Beijerinckia TaxID=2638183 RepID=UPI00089B4FB4|nr:MULTISPECIES: hypothetical protein [unclassified Beijerinckia]MDH7797690.1 hypothetical protein [Beijerinckia sp. GAS462]SEC95090.1 hypothetical protein SAMN05443249_3983 [Beijerinckia sp. 28-YEA-48]
MSDTPMTVDKEGQKLPSGASFDLAKASAAAAADSDAERNSVFASLVSGDADIVGLVAYSIYKQNKHDWLVSFSRIKSREPDEGELSAYIIGESTPRRLATYRHLAQATLDGRGPEVSTGVGGQSYAQQGLGKARNGRSAPGSMPPTLWIGLTVVVLILAYLAARAGWIKV